jgi:5-methylcytosine-specific restriction endonuclease McrA
MYKQQKGLCWICGEKMAISPGAYNSPKFATFDHLVPKAHGGKNAQENLKLAHRKCNMDRADLPVLNVMIVTVQL